MSGPRASLEPRVPVGPDGRVASPCIDICRIGGQGLCEGCLRTLDEIAAWGQADDGLRRQIWARVEQRRRDGPAGSPAR